MDCIDMTDEWDLVGKLQQLVAETKSNMMNLEREVSELRQNMESSAPDSDPQGVNPSLPPPTRTREVPLPPPTPPGSAMVPEADIYKLKSQIGALKEALPKLLNKDILSLYGQMEECKTELNLLRTEVEHVSTDRDYWKSRWSATLSEADRERSEKFKHKLEVQSLGEQLSQQTEYCTSMGAACCTLLWRVSMIQESIPAILVGSKVDEFLTMVGSTLNSYLATYKEDLPQENSTETQFILALCGIVTNIAAASYGREFLVTNLHGRRLVDILLTVISEAPRKRCGKLVNLILMALYNISINRKGLKYLSSKPGLVGLIAWQIQKDTDIQNRISSVKLVHSLLYDQENDNLLLEANEVLSEGFLRQLSTDGNPTLRQASLDLMSDLKSLNAIRENKDK